MAGASIGDHKQSEILRDEISLHDC